MRVVVDSTALVFLIDPEARSPIDPATGERVSYPHYRLEGLLDNLDKDDAEVVIPTPVLSELLILAGPAVQDIVQILRNKRAVRIHSFDEACAIENAMLRRNITDYRMGDAKKQVTFDLQILATARVVQADVVLTDDVQLKKQCARAGLRAISICDLKIPASRTQADLELPSLASHSETFAAVPDFEAPLAPTE